MNADGDAMARDPEQVANVARKSSGRGDPSRDNGNHPWSMATKIAAGLFATIIAPLIVALILKMLDSNPAPAPTQANATQSTGDAKSAATPDATPSATAPPQPTRPARRFTPIFNGKDFSGWTLGKESYWSVDAENRTLVGDDPEGVRSPEPHWIYTVKEYGDFRLRFEYRFVGPSIGGISVRRFLAGKSKAGTLRIQLIADDHHRGAEFPTGNVTAIGGGEGRQLVAKAIATECQRPTGDWNRAMIDFRGPHLLMRINGTLVQDYQREMGADLKATQTTEAPTAPIGLQILTGKIEFRGLQIDELAPGDP
jgi:hypothetical protein